MELTIKLLVNFGDRVNMRGEDCELQFKSSVEGYKQTGTVRTSMGIDLAGDGGCVRGGWGDMWRTLCAVEKVTTRCLSCGRSVGVVSSATGARQRSARTMVVFRLFPPYPGFGVVRGFHMRPQPADPETRHACRAFRENLWSLKYSHCGLFLAVSRHGRAPRKVYLAHG